MSSVELQEPRSPPVAPRPYRPDDAAVARAKANIEAIRKREIELRLIDRAGRPVPHAAIEFIQTRHHFLFGAPLSLTPHDRQSLFRAIDLPTPNALEDQFHQSGSPADAFQPSIDAALAAGRILRSGTLFNPAPPSWPARFREYETETQSRFLEVAIRRRVHRHCGRFAIRDAVCGSLWEPAIDNAKDRRWPHLDPVGDLADYIEPILHWCRHEDPDAIYSISDYGLETDAGSESPLSADGTHVTAPHQRRRLLALVNELVLRGNPPDALGILGNGAGWINHGTQLAAYDELGASRLPLHIVGFNPSPPAAHRFEAPMVAEFAANYLTCAFGHAAVEGFFLSPWLKADAASTTMSQLINHDWKTHVHLRTDADGRVRLRGFLGDYTLRYSLSDRAQRGLPLSLTTETPNPLILVAPFARSGP